MYFWGGESFSMGDIKGRAMKRKSDLNTLKNCIWQKNYNKKSLK